MKKIYSVTALMLCLGLMLSTPASAGGVKYENDKGHWVKLGGRIQLQYHSIDPDGADSTDELRFRRLRPYIEGSLHEDWKGKFQWDMGKEEVVIKDAYFLYSGLDMMDIGIGNMNFPFSRELITSSKYQQLVERTFVGDHNYGTPDRQTGIHLMGGADEFNLDWNFSLAMASQDPSNAKLDFEPTIQIDKGADWSDGIMIGGSVDWYPRGKFKHKQGDLKRSEDLKFAFGLSAFTWSNDDDNLDPTRGDDVESVTGIGLNAALRGMGWSADMGYNTFNSDLEDAGITAGMYDDSETTLNNFALEGGYMVMPEKLEIVAGYQTQDADNYDERWTRASIGLNYFVRGHDIKYQLTHRSSGNVDGVDGADASEIFLQAQYVF